MQLRDIDNELETCDTEDIDWNKDAFDTLADFQSKNMMMRRRRGKRQII